MKTKMICIGLAICSLATINSRAQEIDVTEKSTSISTSAESETDVATENNGKKQRKNRIERSLPGGGVQIEEFSEDAAPSKKPIIRRRVQVIENGNVVEDEEVFEDRVDVRPQIRVFPKEKELIIRRGPGQREMRIELDSDDLDRPSVRRDIARVRKLGPRADASDIDAPIEHLEEAVRHLKKAKKTEAAARLETELEQLRQARKAESDQLNDQLNSLREERDALKDELEKLKRELEQNRDGAKEKTDAGKQ